ncbi:polysaccharide pyruvyl transferase CsaB [Ruminiclostridium sufflavum DSM 19573]|uniref:Polysaccharide pyruvyl transferase CsaB n=1 Tax=Ruminiclostridium sufflavum DSM 19573 TaxID=1121337 RepID=A0A318XL70_9FIRM|nr:polysaccharide pyruvyl transferase CsaB [Ruminiclostridium sufflavum]PYG87994.1 polysaccharide pyruvyl transferase CsaB [Ruminiclostridium sufflavum DSM 19573]
MKVLHMIGGGDVGGAKVHVLSLVKELTSHIDVTLLSLRPGAFADDARAMGLNVEVIKSSNVISDISNTVKFVNKNNFDIIHSHGAKANIFAYAIKKACNVPVVTTMHSDYKLDYMQSFYKKMTIGLLNSIVLRRLDYYIVVTSAFRKMLTERGYKDSRIYTILNGIDFGKPLKNYNREDFCKKYGISSDESDIFVGTAARLDPVKDIGTLLEAAKLVVDKNPKVKFIIGGEGDESKDLKARAANLGLNKNVFFVGWLNDPYELISILDINVMTSISEGFPYYLLEGARFSKATICSRVGGIPDLLESSVNGYLFEPRDYNTLAEQLLILSSDSAKREDFGRKLYTKADKDFSLTAMCRTQLEIYNSISRVISHKYKQKKYDAIISGYYGFNNIGDDAMLRSIVFNLKQQKPDISILALSRRPEETSMSYGIYSINRKNVFTVYSAMRKAKLFIYGGGNIIQDSTSSRSLIYYLSTAWLAKRLSLKVMFYANGIGPINKSMNAEFSRRILNRADIITVREKWSYNELKKMGITKPKIVLTADAALAIKNDEKVQAEIIFDHEGIPFDGKYAGFSVRRCPGLEDCQHVKYEKTIAEIADYVYLAYGLKPVFIPMEYQADIFTVRNIVSKMKTDCYIISDRHSVSETFAIIKKMDIMIAMRLHALIFSAYMNVPFLGISYQPKVEGFLEYVNQPSAGNVKDLSFENMRSKVDHIMQNKASIKAELAESVEALVSKAEENSRLAIELIDSIPIN